MPDRKQSADDLMELVLIKTCDISDQQETNSSLLMLLKQLKFNHNLLSFR